VAVPAPEKLTACGPLLVLPAMNSVAVRIPVASGVKITWMVQLVPAATVGPQELLSEKSPPSVPPIVIAERFSASWRNSGWWWTAPGMERASDWPLHPGPP